MIGNGKLLRELDLFAESVLLGFGLVVVANFANSHDAVLAGEVGELGQDLFGQADVVRFLAIQANGAVMGDAELPRSKAFPAAQHGEVIDE